MFGMGMPLSLIGSLAATQNSATPYTRLAGAALIYLRLAALAVWVTRQSGKPAIGSGVRDWRGVVRSDS